MFAIIGILVVFGMVFGGYLIGGGNMAIVLKALPMELMIIGGAAVGAFLIANSTDVIKKSLRGMKNVFRGSKWTSSDYTDLLSLLYELIRLEKSQGLTAIEAHIERPDESEIWARYSKIRDEAFARDLICDSFRLQTLQQDINAYQVEEIIDKQIKKYHNEAMEPARSLQTTADALPALGIVAAVLGVIKTMSSIDQPPEVLGLMIGGALVGTFLGVFLSYGFVGPAASRLRQIVDEEGTFYFVVRDVLAAMKNDFSAQAAVEAGRINIPSKMQPSFVELEQALRSLPRDGGGQSS